MIINTEVYNPFLEINVVIRACYGSINNICRLYYYYNNNDIILRDLRVYVGQIKGFKQM